MELQEGLSWFSLRTTQVVKAKCRSEPEFEQRERVYVDGRRFINCPICGRRYFWDPKTKKYISDRPLVIVSKEYRE